MADRAQTVTVDGRRLRITNLDKVLYPSTGTTKADVLDYYARIAPVLLPHVRDRPLTRKRWVHGVGTEESPGEVFFQKNLDEGTPDWVERRTFQHKTSSNTYPVVEERATLAWLAQIAALELHVPQWKFAADGQRSNPDRIVLDLDPGDGVGLAECVEVARWAKEILEGAGLKPLPVTSGSKGIHLYARLDGSQSSDRISEFAHELARALEADHSDLVVSDMKKSLRLGKVLVDWSQNSAAKTTIAPYSLRGRTTPTVAAPRTWDELESPDLRQLDYREVLKRVEERGDPLRDLETATGTDRLEQYRSMRDAAKTPEPVPDERAPSTDGRSFVIQEHHATRLHYDFRLERDGVLVSWAIPKGVPSTPKENHLAVHTEDHPLEYGTFEGTIPKGEYGGGTVTIWDSGTYDLEKWRDDEVIVVLHGRAEGGLGGDPAKVALIRTGKGSSEAKNWLAHRMVLDGNTGGTRSTAARSGRGTSMMSSAAQDGGIEDARRRLEKGPMLASSGSEADVADGEAWVYEMKWDGIRALADIDPTSSDQRVRLTSRNGNDLTAAYPELAAIADSIDASEAIVDGEIVALDGQGRPDFGLLQKRMNLVGAADIERARRDVPVRFVAFDLLAVDSRSLLAESYTVRRAELERVVHARGPVQIPPIFDGGDVADALAASRSLRLEGVVAKKSRSDYAPGRRSGAWIKLKHHLMQEVVIGGWRPGNGRREGGVGSLLLGIPAEGGLDYVGRVGTGFSDRLLDELGATLGELETETTPFLHVPRLDSADAHWVTPSLVGEVEFAEWTSTGRLRQPSWRGWRPDKAPADVVRETP